MKLLPLVTWKKEKVFNELWIWLRLFPERLLKVPHSIGQSKSESLPRFKDRTLDFTSCEESGKEFMAFVNLY